MSGTADKAAAQATKEMASLNRSIWENFGQPEALRWAQGRANMEPIRQGFQNWLTGKPATSTPIVNVASQMKPTPKAWTDLELAKAWQDAGLGPSDFLMREQYMNRKVDWGDMMAEIARKQGAQKAAALQAAVDKANQAYITGKPAQPATPAAKPVLPAAPAASAAQPVNPTPAYTKVLPGLPTAPAASAVQPAAPAASAAQPVNPTPETRPQAAVDEANQAYIEALPDQPDALGSARFDPSTFLAKPVAVPTLADAPDWRTVGSEYANAVNNANLLALDTAVRRMAGDATAGLAGRGLMNSSMAPTSSAAIGNWAARTKAELDAKALMDRMSLEQALRAEGNANQWARTAWEAEQQALREKQMYDALGWLAGDNTMQLNPYQAITGAATAAQLAGDQANRAFQQQMAKQQQKAAMAQIIGGIIGSAIGAPKLFR